MKSGEKWGQVEKSGGKVGKVVAKSGEMWGKWRKVVKSGEKWLKSGLEKW